MERSFRLIRQRNIEYRLRKILYYCVKIRYNRIKKTGALYYNKAKAMSKTGRKNSFTIEQITKIMALKEKGTKITHIAEEYQVSRQTIYTQIKKAHRFSNDPDVKMRMNYMNRDNLCTTIDIDFKHEKIWIQNYTKQIPLRAFGVVERPDWKDFEIFLEDRCFPRTRDHAKDILRDMGVPFYDPLLIIEKTKGRMEGDHQWIMILKKEG
jgi:predicted DNA-binding protein YlxM (UPF0122 family)